MSAPVRIIEFDEIDLPAPTVRKGEPIQEPADKPWGQQFHEQYNAQFWRPIDAAVFGGNRAGKTAAAGFANAEPLREIDAEERIRAMVRTIDSAAQVMKYLSDLIVMLMKLVELVAPYTPQEVRKYLVEAASRSVEATRGVAEWSEATIAMFRGYGIRK